MGQSPSCQNQAGPWWVQGSSRDRVSSSVRSMSIAPRWTALTIGSSPLAHGHGQDRAAASDAAAGAAQRSRAVREHRRRPGQGGRLARGLQHHAAAPVAEHSLPRSPVRHRRRRRRPVAWFHGESTFQPRLKCRELRRGCLRPPGAAPDWTWSRISTAPGGSIPRHLLLHDGPGRDCGPNRPGITHFLYRRVDAGNRLGAGHRRSERTESGMTARSSRGGRCIGMQSSR